MQIPNCSDYVFLTLQIFPIDALNIIRTTGVEDMHPLVSSDINLRIGGLFMDEYTITDVSIGMLNENKQIYFEG